MTLDELTQLTEALTAELDLSALRAGKGPNLDDQGYVLLVRFLGGERAEVPAPAPTPVTAFSGAQSARREREPISEEEAARRLAAIEALEREAPAKATNLGDGVILGFDFDD